MKKIITILIGILSVWLTFTGCESPSIGYLITEDVTYPIDSMVVMSFPRLEQEVLNLEQKKINFDSSEEGKVILKKKEELEAITDIYSHKVDSVQDIMYELEYKMYDENPYISDEEFDRLYSLWEEQYEVVDEFYRLWDEIDAQISEVMAVRKEAIGNIDHDILKIQRQIQDTIPWTSSPIEGVLGTDPIIYSIAEVKGEDHAKANLFSKYLTIIGGGRFVLYWSKNEFLPVGRYVVSIQISNEGYSRVINDVFTFIVK